ncbi:DUF6010 family protein [Pseudoalteromonas sp. A25]|uniref:DUF6010 family protein n=1 Tax=Pseudoalteromonas sp. A25 TaxID=116092 RepID=UPI0018D9EFCE|nr:DUF6010 family protein [Pseudoalteromonas sp. A25]
MAFWLAFGFATSLILIRFGQSRSLQSKMALFAYALIIASLIYVGFAVLAFELAWVLIETVGVLLFGIMVMLSRTHSRYFLALGWLVHPVWDVVLHLYWPDTHFAPNWYAIMCISFDITVGGYLIVLFKRQKVAL